MSFFDQAYDEMSWQEVCYRLPSELAVNAIKRRVTNLDTLRMLFENVGAQPANIKPLKEHINNIVSAEDPDDILDAFAEDFEKVLFSWLDSTNKDKLRNHDASKLSTKFLFNVTSSDDRSGLKEIMNRVLQDPVPNQSYIRSVLNKADDNHFPTLLDTILKDSRPEVRVCVLGVGGLSNNAKISDLQKTIGLKALAKCSSNAPIGNINVLSIQTFASLKPLERLTALERYLRYFPLYKKVSAFSPTPTQDEFDMILFAGCIEHNERVTKINELYKKITTEDNPNSE